MRNVKPGHTKPIVCLDAGHYGKYNRSPAVPEYYESEMNWKLHNYQAEELEKHGIEVIKTRFEQEKDMELYDRGAAAEDADMFLSDHSNAVGSRVDENVDYVRIYCLYDDDGTEIDEQSRELALQMAPVIADTMQTRQEWQVTSRRSDYDSNGDGEMNDNYYGVLNGARMVGTAGIILEHSFHTNTRMTKWLLEDSNLHKLAKAEAKVLAEYFGMAAEAPDQKPEADPAPAEKPAAAPKAQTCTVTLPVLRSGDKGGTVKVMQTLLDFHGYPCANGGADGIFGNGTKEALKYFQAEKDLDTDAVCGPLTWAALMNV